MKKVAIIWAWPAWMSAAYELSQNPWYEIVIYEKWPTVWGMAWSTIFADSIVDFWPHRFFTKYGVIDKMRDDVLWDDLVWIKRQTRMYYNNYFLDYPIDILNVIKTLPLSQLITFWFSYLKAKIFPYRDPKNFEEYIINNFWRSLYNTFFKTYTEKLRWVKCTQLDKKWAQQRIKWVSISNLIKKVFLGDRMKNKVKSWVDEFKYPKYWNIHFYNKLKDILESRWVKFIFNYTINEIHYNDIMQIYINDNLFDYLINTSPIDIFAKLFSNFPSDLLSNTWNLNFRNTILIYALIDKKDLFTDQWIYLHSKDIIAWRMTNFNNRSYEQISDHNKSYVVLEYWDDNDGKMRNADDMKLHDIAVKDLVNMFDLSEDMILQTMVKKIYKCYPVYTIWYEDNIDKISDYFKSLKNIYTIWRNWSFKYNNQDHAMYMWYLVAKNILWENHDLWEVNTDTEYHEEQDK